MDEMDPQRKSTARFLLSSIEDGGSKGLRIETAGRQLDLLLVRKGEEVYCYLNRCPHTGVNLDWVPDQFLDNESTYIQCATHGALFRIEDGFCVAGPCAGQALSSIQVKNDGEYVDILAFT